MPIICTITIPPPLASPLPGCPSRYAPPALVVWGASKRFSIDPGGLFRADDFVFRWVC